MSVRAVDDADTAPETRSGRGERVKFPPLLFLCLTFVFRFLVFLLGCPQALVKPWAAFEKRVPLCGSLRGFIRLHEAYLDVILERYVAGATGVVGWRA